MQIMTNKVLFHSPNLLNIVRTAMISLYIHVMREEGMRCTKEGRTVGLSILILS